jgi:hypothetical protein
MVEPFTLIALILAAAAGLTLVVVAVVYWDDIVNWFQSRNNLKVADRDNIAFTIKDRMASGEYTVIQGIFNKRTEEILDGRKMRTKALDSQFDRAHKDQDLVIYE